MQLAGQNYLIDLYKKKFKSRADRRLLDEFNALVRSYYPNYSDKDVVKVYDDLCKNGCTYSSIANVIMVQLKNNIELFELYGNNMLDVNGSVNCNKLVLDIFLGISKAIELTVCVPERYIFDSRIEAARRLLDIELNNDTDATNALLNQGYRFEGLTEDRKLIIEKMGEVQCFLDNCDVIAHKLFGIVEPGMDKDRLEEFLNLYGCSYKINYTEFFEKFSGFGALVVDNRNKWLNRYFEKKGINLSGEFGFFHYDYNSYEEFMNGVMDKVNNGYSIVVSSKKSKNEIYRVWAKGMEKKDFGWAQISLEDFSHSMYFEDFDGNGDIIVNFWGISYLIPKDYYPDCLEFCYFKLFRCDRNFGLNDNKIR